MSIEQVSNPHSDAPFFESPEPEACRVCDTPINAYELCEKCAGAGFGGIPEQGDEHQPTRGAFNS